MRYHLPFYILSLRSYFLHNYDNQDYAVEEAGKAAGRLLKEGKHSIYGYKIKFVPLLLNLNIIIMYSSEDLQIKCKSNTMKLASFFEMQPLLYIDIKTSIKTRGCFMANR